MGGRGHRRTSPVAGSILRAAGQSATTGAARILLTFLRMVFACAVERAGEDRRVTGTEKFAAGRQAKAVDVLPENL